MSAYTVEDLEGVIYDVMEGWDSRDILGACGAEVDKCEAIANVVREVEKKINARRAPLPVIAPPKSSRAESCDNDVYCMSCGEEHDLACLGNYPNGIHWECRVCGNEFMG